MANIAMVTAVPKATSSNVQTGAGAKAPSGPDALFVAMLQQASQGATGKPVPANDAPATQNDNAADPSQPNTQPDMAKLVATLQAAAKPAPANNDALPQPDAPADTPAAGAQTAKDAANSTAGTKISAAADAIAVLPQPANGNMAGDATSITGNPADSAAGNVANGGNGDPAKGGSNAPKAAATTAADNETKSAAAQVTVANDLKMVPDATAAILQPVQNNAPAAKTATADKQKAATDAKTTGSSDAKPAADPAAAQDPGILAALMSAQQTQTPQPVKTGGQASGTKTAAVDGAKPTGSGTDAKAAPTVAADQPPPATGAAAPVDSGKPTASKQSAEPIAPGKPVDGGKIAKDNAAASQTAATQQASPTGQSSTSTSLNSQPAPSVMATLAQTTSATNTSLAAPTTLAANLQVVPQHYDAAASTPFSALGLTIATKSHDGLNHFDIRMDPAELGSVQVHLSVDNSGKTQATIVADRPQTLQLLQSDSANLARSLTDAGLNLSNNGLNFSLRGGQERQNGNGNSPNGRGRALTINAVAATDAISHSNPIASLAPDSVRLDIRV
ncbi:MAG: flagellar hook-length control protein FliK [Alphaproteobacteria bacterium]|nr:flagellar hook-length control protein FliK [Alphaproteobacteria bacterium]